MTKLLCASLFKSRTPRDLQKQQGVSLVIVMLILIVVSVLGVGGIQIAMMGERGTRNDRDMQIAWQGAEAGLIDAEFDIEGQPASSTNKRNSIFKRGEVDIPKFAVNCGDSGQSKGLCQLNGIGTKPAWLAVDFTATGSGARAVALGTYTGRDFPSGAKGTQPAAAPRYVIELVQDPSKFRTDPNAFVYRVTSMGFGPNAETQAVLQMIYRN